MKSCASCYSPVIVGKSIDKKDMSFVSTNRVAFGAGVVPQGSTTTARSKGSRGLSVRASAVDSYESSSDFVKRMEKAWVISQVQFSFNVIVCGLEFQILLVLGAPIQFYQWFSFHDGRISNLLQICALKRVSRTKRDWIWLDLCRMVYLFIF